MGEDLVLITLEHILSRIADGSLLPSAYYCSIDRDAALEARDCDEMFDFNWAIAHKRIDAAWVSSSVSDHERTLVEDIRREAFGAVSLATSQHEIASYVSDDLDLIARANVLGLTDAFLLSLWASYVDGRFPFPERRRSVSTDETNAGSVPE